MTPSSTAMGHTPALRPFSSFAAPFLIAPLLLPPPQQPLQPSWGPPALVPGRAAPAGILWAASRGWSQESGTVLDPPRDPVEALGLGSSCWRAMVGAGLGSDSVHPSLEGGLERGCTGLEMGRAENGLYCTGNGLYWAMLGYARLEIDWAGTGLCWALLIHAAFYWNVLG